MPNTSNLSKLLQGMNQDMHSSNLDDKTYPFALNAITSDFTGNEFLIGNEPSTICNVAFPPNYQVIGFVEIAEQHRTIYILINPLTGSSQIGEVRNCINTIPTDKLAKVFCANCPEDIAIENQPLQLTKEICHCQYRLIVPTTCLNLDVNFPVDIEYKITECGINIYFTDNLNERRFMYFSYEFGFITDNLVLDKRFKVSTDINDTGGCTCPVGYTYNPTTNMCDMVTVTPIIPSGTVRTACRTSNVVYTSLGVAIYTTFNVDGTGASTLYHQSNSYWSNPTNNTTNGVLNRTALWACDAAGNPQTGTMLPINENIGFIFPVDLLTTKTYYVGIAGDNTITIRLDCQDVVVMNPTTVGTQYGVGASATFKYWHIYPITIPAGHHVIELTGRNFGSVAGFGAEIYDNTAAELIAATSSAGLNIIFTTSNKAGQPLQISNTFSGTCPNGGCIDLDINNNLVCRSLVSVPADCDPCQPIIYTNTLDCDKTKFNPDYGKPCIDFIDFVNGGNLKAGSYQILIAYADVYGNPMTTYSPSSPIAPLFEKQITFETNYETNKALKFTINNLKTDSIFEYYNIVIAQTIDQFTEFIQAGTFPISQKDYLFTGFEKSIKRLDPTEVFFRRPFYQKAKGVTTANNYLFFTGLQEYKNLNLQPIANKINLYWQTSAIKEPVYAQARNTFKARTFMRDEVYPVGIIFEFNNGRETCAFHIPGRVSIPSDLTTVTNGDVITNIDCDTEIINKNWQVYNTADILGTDHEYTENCDDLKCWEYGKFAYWESTENYPNDTDTWGDLCGQPIRHHKFPDSTVTHIHDSLNGTKGVTENNYVFPIGIRIDHQSILNALTQAVVDSVLTQAERDSIKSYRIVRGNRVGHKSIDAKGLLFNMFQYTKFGKDYFFPNYAYNDISTDDFLDEVILTPNRYTFHSPDTHFVNAGLGNILKIETEEYGKNEAYFTYSDCQAKHKFLSDFAQILAFGLGIAAAISATGEKTCKVITYDSDAITKYGDQHVDSASINPWQTFTGPAGATTPTGTGSLGQHDIQQDDTTEIKSNMPADTYNLITGNTIASTRNAASEQITTCKGESFQVFNSDPFLNGLFGLANTIIQRTFLGIQEMDKILDTIRTLIPHRNYSIQHNSYGVYNNYSLTAQGNRLRKIDKSAYLNPIMQSVDEPSTAPNTAFTTVSINNWHRESSVYLKLNTNFTAPIHIDNSKVSMRNLGFNVDDLNRTFNRNISSYYTSIKRYVPNQYGQICNVNYLETSGCSFSLNTIYQNCDVKVFGGDTFINRFGLKRKMPFFLHDMCGLPNDTDVEYSELANAGKPKYFFDTSTPLGERIADLGLFPAIYSAIVHDNVREYDIKKNQLFNQNGYMHLFNYGIPYFLVESDINVDYRHGQNNKEKDFFPHKRDLKEWFEEDFVSIKEDNTYFYNRTYSKQNTESPICTNCILTKDDLKCSLHSYNRLIYSDPTDTENKNDNWLIFKANNFYDFPLTKGRLISADGIENDKVLVRLEKGTQIFSAYNTIQATEENIQVGTGGIFQSRPRDIAVTDLGYGGTQHKDILHTEYGHIWADTERGQVFNLATGGGTIDEISKDGMKNWFKENLPFQLLKDFNNLPITDIDNNLNGIGLHMCFDKRFHRCLLTKLDYKLIDKTLGVKYNAINKYFYILDGIVETKISLKNPKYFCTKSWTISYNFLQKSWVSFHSYTPEFYVEHIDTFESGYKNYLGQQKMYTHNATNKSYQVVYGKLQPFIIEFYSKFGVQNNFLNSVEYNLDVIRYHNEYDTFFNRTKSFNKAIIYNDNQTSGLLTFKVADPENLAESFEYPKLTLQGYEVLITNSENIWHFNDFFDVSKNQLNNLPLFNYDCNNVNKKLNPIALNYDKPDFDRAGIRSRQSKIRLIQDVESNYKFLLNFSQINNRQSIR